LTGEAIEQGASFPEIAGVEALGELPINIGEHHARLVATAGGVEHGGQRVGRTQLEEASLLAAGELDRVAVDALHGAARVVYLSTTAVYGGAECVDETTPVAPQSDRARARVRTERAVLDGPWLPLVLRPAAIYGPGRGVQVSMRHGSGCVSRIHVDDLAAHVEAALFSEVAGAWPVADDHPCPSSEIANFILLHPEWGRPVACGGLGQGRSRAGLLIHGQGRHLSFARGQGRLSHASRRVDGSAIRRILGIALRYPSYRTGIPAALAEQRHACHDRGFQ
jgi:nucleoside-diphosphate-sugar epimerase